MIDTRIIKKPKQGGSVIAGGLYTSAQTPGNGLVEIQNSLGIVLNIVNNMSNVFIPVREDGTRTQWGAPDMYAVKSVKGFYSEEFLSARGLNPFGDGGVIEPGLDENALALYLTNNHYAKLGDIPSLTGYAKLTDIPSLTGYAKLTDIPSLTGYATETWVLGNNYLVASDISGKADKATTLGGYGITDAKIDGGVITLGTDTITPLVSADMKTLTFAAGKFTAKTYTPDASAQTVNVPTKTSHLTNDSDFTTNAILNAGLAKKLDKAVFEELFEKVNIGTETSPVWAIKAKMGLYTEEFLSARGLNTSGGTGTASSYNRLDAWIDYAADKADYVLSAKLGYDLYQKKLNKYGSDGVLEIGSHLDFHTVTNGTVGTEDYTVRLSGGTGTGRQFSFPSAGGTLATQGWVTAQKYLTDHQDISSYLKSADAAATYLTQTDAVNTYQPKGTYLTSHQTIHTLTFAVGSFTAKTFTANSAAATVNIPTTTTHITEGTRLYFTDARAQSALASTISDINDAIDKKVAKAGDTMTGTLILPRLDVVGSASSTAYLTADNASNVYFGLGTRIPFVINDTEACVRPGNSYDNIFALGKDKARWSNVYSVLGNFSSIVTAPIVHWTDRLTLNGVNGVYIRFNSDDTKSVYLKDTAFKPFDSANNKLTLGTASARWANTYSVLGNFSGLVTADAGIQIGDCKITWEAGKGLKFSKGIYSEEFVSARGLNPDGSAGGGLITNVYGTQGLGNTFLDTDNNNTFNAFTIQSIHKRVFDLESGAAVEVETTGSGNAVTSISKNGTKITATKSTTFLIDHQPLYTLTIQKNGTQVGTFKPNANATINISDVASAATLSSHTGNATVHITSEERKAWNGAVTNLNTILGSDASGVIDKWDEIVAFLDTYTEADTLANLLSNKADKSIKITAGTGLTGGGTLAADCTLSLATSGVTAGSYNKVTVDTYGRVTAGSNPTTLAGHGITDAYTKTAADNKFVDFTTDQSITGVKTFNTLKIANSGNGTARPTTGIAVNGILGTMASNDQWAIFGYGTAADNGYMEIATGDNGNEPIYVAQYKNASPLSTSSVREHGITLMNASGNQVFNGTSVDTLTIRNTAAVAHIIFSREGYNYFTAPANGLFAFISNGKAVGSATSDLTIENNSVHPGTTNAVTLGTSTLRWSNVNSVLGNFSGLITASAGIKIGEVTITYDSTNKGLKVSGGGLYSESYISANGVNTSGSSGGFAFNLMREWPSDDPGVTTNEALGANLGWELKQGKLNATKAAIEALLTGGITTHTHSLITNGGNLTAVTGTTTMPSGLRLYSVYNNGYPTTYGNLLRIGGIGSGELLCGWTGTTAVGGLFYRSKRDQTATAWSDWVTLVTSANIGSYAITAHQSLAAYIKTADANAAYVTSLAIGTKVGETDHTHQLAWAKNGTTNYLTIPYATRTDYLRNNTALTYGNSGVQWFNISGTAGCVAKVNDTPTSAWWHILRFNHANNNGYYTDLAVPFNANSLYYKRVASGALANDHWVRIVDDLNYSTILDGRYVKKAGDTMTGLLTLKHADAYGQLAVYRASTTGISAILFKNDEKTLGKIGIGGSGNTYPYQPTFVDVNSVQNKMWHSGNDGSGSGLDADLLDGLHLSNIRGYGYAMQSTTIDASSLDENTWYPVTINIGAGYDVMIQVIVNLNSGTKPSWSTHNNGFSVRKIWKANGSGYGTNAINRTIYASDSSWCSADPVRGLGQMSRSSNEYVYVRGGGKYFFYTSHGCTPVLRTSTFTQSEESVSPTTTAPAAISRNNARTSDNVASATKLQTARTIWGQSFDGTGNVSGDLTSVGNITGSAAVTLKATGILTLNGTSGIYLRYNGDDTKSLYLKDTAFKPFDAANNVLSLGTTTARWSNVYSVLGSFTGTISSSKTTSTYLAGNQGAAIINSTANAGAYTMLAKMNTTNGYMTFGVYQTRFELHYTAKTVVDASTNNITHNITLLDEAGLTTVKKLKIGSITLEDLGGNLHIDKGVYSDAFVSAKGLNGQSGGSGTAYNRLDAWTDYAADKADYVLSAKLGNELYQKKLNKYGSDGVLEIGSHLDFHTVTNGTVGTEDFTVRLSGGTATGRQFSFPDAGGTLATQGWVTAQKYLTSHQSLANYVTLNSAQTISAVKTFSAGLKLNTAETWTDADRCIPFAQADDMAIMRYYYNDTTKGLRYNPNTGVLKSGRFSSSFASGTWIKGMTEAVLNLTHTTYGAVFNAPVKAGRVSLSTYPSSDNVVYLGYIPTTQTDNKLAKSLTWKADDGRLTADLLTIKNTEAMAHIAFSRGGYNYFSAPASGVFGFVTNGKAAGVGANCDLIIQNNNLRPGTNNTVSVGTTTERWSNIYSTLGNFSGTVTAPTVHWTDILSLNGVNGLYLRYNNSGTQSLVLNATAFKPFASATNSIDLGAANSVWKDVYARKYTSDTTVYLTSANKSSIIFVCGTTEHMRIWGGASDENKIGFVGINTSSPAYPLDVNGDIRSTASVRANTQLVTPKVHSAGRLTLNCTNTALDLKFASDDTKSVILNGSAFKPFDAADGKLELGTDAARWLKITACNMRLSSSTSAGGGDVYAEFWRGSNASWKMLNTGGTLHIQCNYTDKVGDYFDCVRIAYNSGDVAFKGVVSPMDDMVHNFGKSTARWKDIYTKRVVASETATYNAAAPAATSYLGGGNMELYAATPYIDFHFGNSTADYTTRIIEEVSGRLKIVGTLRTTVGMYSDGYVSARGQNTSSDARLKMDLKPMAIPVAMIAGAPSVRFRWKSDGIRDVGTIAQYWQRICPELTPENPSGELTLQYGKTALLACVSIARMSMRHESEIVMLRRRVTELEKEVEQLKAS